MPGCGNTWHSSTRIWLRLPAQGTSPSAFSPQFLPAFRPSQLTHSPTVLRHTTQTPAAQLIFGKKVAKNILSHLPVPSMGQQLIAFEEKKKNQALSPQPCLMAWLVSAALLQTFKMGIIWDVRQEGGKAASAQGCRHSVVIISNTGHFCRSHLPPTTPFLACNALPPSMILLFSLLTFKTIYLGLPKEACTPWSKGSNPSHPHMPRLARPHPTLIPATPSPPTISGPLPSPLSCAGSIPSSPGYWAIRQGVQTQDGGLRQKEGRMVIFTNRF